MAVSVALMTGAMASAAEGATETETAPDEDVSLASVSADLPSVLTGSSLSVLSAHVAEAVGGTSVPIILAPAGDELSLAQAAANASLSGGVAVMAASSNADEVLAQLAPFAPSSVGLVGAPSSFTAEFKAALEAEYGLDETHVAEDMFSRSAAALDPAARAEIVLTDSSDTGVQALAASLAVTSGAALIMLDGAEDLSSVAAVLEDSATTEIAVVGPDAGASPYQETSQAVLNKTMWLDTADPQEAEQAAMQAMVSAGRNADRVVAATDGGVGDRVLAAVAARAGDALTGSVEGVEEYVSKFYGTLDQVVAVGVTASATDVSDLSSTLPAIPSAPAFRVKDVIYDPTDSSYDITTTAATGATKYTAYDINGAEVGASTTTSIHVSDEPESLAIIATKSSSQVAELQMRINGYANGEDRDQVVVGSLSTGGRNHIKFLGGEGIPRVVTRMPVSIYAGEAADPETDTVTVGVTCASEFTDTTLDPTFQYDYRVTTLNNDAEACGNEPTENPEPTPRISGVSFPPTEFPMLDAKRAGVAADGSTTPRAAKSLVDRIILGDDTSGVSTGREASSVSAIGDDWPDMNWRYQGWIRPSKVLGPPPSGRITRPFTFFHGDGRGPNPNGAYRFRQDVKVSFGSSHGLTYSEHMGQTVKYACRWPNGTDCETVSSKTAPLSELSLVNRNPQDIYGWFTFKVDASNPLQLGAPAISSDIEIIYGPGSTRIIGWHDKMPSHEIWFNAEGWGEWENAYTTREVGLHCLVGWLPGCTAYVNLTL